MVIFMAILEAKETREIKSMSRFYGKSRGQEYRISAKIFSRQTTNCVYFRDFIAWGRAVRMAGRTHDWCTQKETQR